LARTSRGRLRISPLTSSEADRELGDVSQEERYSQAWLVGSGQRHAGHEAAWHALYLLPGGFLLRLLRWLPGFQSISRRAYRWVADRRSPACRLRSDASGS
jgi:predicted DCC family thiol-disulfide oxidoreductase YuxK